MSVHVLWAFKKFTLMALVIANLCCIAVGIVLLSRNNHAVSFLSQTHVLLPIVLVLITTVITLLKIKILIPLNTLLLHLKNLRESGSLLAKINQDRLSIAPIKKITDELNLIFEHFTKKQIDAVEQQKKILLNTKMATIGTLASGLSHEINNPLMIINGATSILKSKFYTHDEIQYFSERVMLASLRIQSIINGLKTYSKADNTEFIPININQTLQDTLNLTSHLFKCDGIDIKMNLNSASPLIMGNSGKIQEVIIHILNNAKEALEYTDASATIDLSTEDTMNNETLIKINDNGMGISKENIDKIFDPFFSTKNSEKNTGLGLAISQTIMTQLKGRIAVESNKVNGTTFFLYFKKANLDENLKPKDCLNPEIKKICALVVDDEEDIRWIIRNFLEELEIEVSDAQSVKDAKALFMQKKYDFVFVDVIMPEATGDILIQYIKDNSQPFDLNPTRIFVITGGQMSSYTQEQQKTIRMHADAVITKPFKKEELIQNLQRFNNNSTVNSNQLLSTTKKCVGE